MKEREGVLDFRFCCGGECECIAYSWERSWNGARVVRVFEEEKVLKIVNMYSSVLVLDYYSAVQSRKREDRLNWCMCFSSLHAEKNFILDRRKIWLG